MGRMRAEEKKKKEYSSNSGQKLAKCYNNINLHAWEEAQEIPNIINMKNLYIVTSQSNLESRREREILESSSERKDWFNTGTPLWLAVDFPSKTFKVRRQR